MWLSRSVNAALRQHVPEVRISGRNWTTGVQFKRWKQSVSFEDRIILYFRILSIGGAKLDPHSIQYLLRLHGEPGSCHCPMRGEAGEGAGAAVRMRPRVSWTKRPAVHGCLADVDVEVDVSWCYQYACVYLVWAESKPRLRAPHLRQLNPSQIGIYGGFPPEIGLSCHDCMKKSIHQRLLAIQLGKPLLQDIQLLVGQDQLVLKNADANMEVWDRCSISCPTSSFRQLQRRGQGAMVSCCFCWILFRTCATEKSIETWSKYESSWASKLSQVMSSPYVSGEFTMGPASIMVPLGQFGGPSGPWWRPISWSVWRHPDCPQCPRSFRPAGRWLSCVLGLPTFSPGVLYSRHVKNKRIQNGRCNSAIPQSGHCSFQIVSLG